MKTKIIGIIICVVVSIVCVAVFVGIALLGYAIANHIPSKVKTEVIETITVRNGELEITAPDIKVTVKAFADTTIFSKEKELVVKGPNTIASITNDGFLEFGIDTIDMNLRAFDYVTLMSDGSVKLFLSDTTKEELIKRLSELEKTKTQIN